MPVSDNPTYTYGLLIQTINRYGYTHVNAKVVRRESGTDYPINCSGSEVENAWSGAPDHLHGMSLDGLCMDGLVSVSGGSPEYIGFEAGFRNIHSAHLRKLQGMTKALKKVVDRVHKDEAGSDPGDYLVAFTKALKLDFVVIRHDPDMGSSYLDNKWDWLTIMEGRNAFRRLIHEAKEHVKATKGKVA